MSLNITFRADRAAGEGNNLSATEIDSNFRAIKLAVEALQGTTTPTTPVNVVPTVTFAPANADAAVVGTAKQFAVTATDSDGTIASTKLYLMANATTLDVAQGTLLDTDLTSPYALSWTPTVAGNFPLRVLATDNSGGSKLSDVYQLTVGAATRLLAPAGLWQTSATLDSVTAKWNQVPGNNGYRVFINGVPEVVTANVTTLTKTGLGTDVPVAVYVQTIGNGASDSFYTFAIPFHTAGTPVVNAINPGVAAEGELILIPGSGFGARPGEAGEVRIGGALVYELLEWTNTLITAVVPRGGAEGVVTVTNEYGYTNTNTNVSLARPQLGTHTAKSLHLNDTAAGVANFTALAGRTACSIGYTFTPHNIGSGAVYNFLHSHGGAGLVRIAFGTEALVPGYSLYFEVATDGAPSSFQALNIVPSEWNGVPTSLQLIYDGAQVSLYRVFLNGTRQLLASEARTGALLSDGDVQIGNVTLGGGVDTILDMDLYSVQYWPHALTEAESLAYAFEAINDLDSLPIKPLAYWRTDMVAEAGVRNLVDETKPLTFSNTSTVVVGATPITEGAQSSTLAPGPVVTMDVQARTYAVPAGTEYACDYDGATWQPYTNPLVMRATAQYHGKWKFRFAAAGDVPASRITLAPRMPSTSPYAGIPIVDLEFPESLAKLEDITSTPVRFTFSFSNAHGSNFDFSALQNLGGTAKRGGNSTAGTPKARLNVVFDSKQVLFPNFYNDTDYVFLADAFVPDCLATVTGLGLSRSLGLVAAKYQRVLLRAKGVILGTWIVTEKVKQAIISNQKTVAGEAEPPVAYKIGTMFQEPDEEYVMPNGDHAYFATPAFQDNSPGVLDTQDRRLYFLYPKPENLTAAWKDYGRQKALAVEAAASDSYTAFKQLANADSFHAAWMVFEWMKNADAERSSSYCHILRGGKMTQSPMHDYDCSSIRAISGALPTSPTFALVDKTTRYAVLATHPDYKVERLAYVQANKVKIADAMDNAHEEDYRLFCNGVQAIDRAQWHGDELAVTQFKEPNPIKHLIRGQSKPILRSMIQRYQALETLAA